jgi:23S rRNA (uracil1939-C5)-methyltransferase
MEELAEEERIDAVVLNPPRKGCDEAVLQRVAGLTPRRVVYVSCSPESLIRDLNILKNLGYVCREIQPVDMFPQTVHVENVALLEKDDKSA